MNGVGFHSYFGYGTEEWTRLRANGLFLLPLRNGRVDFKTFVGIGTVANFQRLITMCVFW